MFVGLNRFNKGQISLILVVCVVILALAGIIFFIYAYFHDIEFDVSSQTSFEKRPIETYIQACLDAGTDEVISLVSATGGFLYSYEPHIVSSQMIVALTQESDNTIQPSKKFIENELAKGISDYTKFCLYKSTLNEQYVFDFKIVGAQSNIIEDRVDFTVNVDGTVIDGNSIHKVKSTYKKGVDSPLYTLLRARDDYVRRTTQNIDLFFFDRYDAKAVFLPFSSEHYIVRLEKSHSQNPQKALMYQFGVNLRE